MTIGLSYNDDISRVQVSVTGLPFSTGTIRIERSTNGLYWETVRGAAELPVSGGAAAVDDFEFSADVENTYRVVPIDPVPGLHLSGNTGSYASTPDHASLRVTGDLELNVAAEPDQGWAPGSDMALVARYNTAGDRSYMMLLRSDGTLRQNWSTDGSSASAIDSGVPVTDVAANGLLGISHEFNVDVGGTDKEVTFETGGSLDGPWNQLGLVQTVAGTTSINAGTAELEVGSFNSGLSGQFSGIVNAVRVYDGIDGTVVADPDFTGQAMGATSFTDSTGKLWTVNGDAYLVGTETNSITPSLGGVAWFKSIKHPFLNRPIHRVLAGGGQEIGRAARDGVFQVQGRSVPIVVSDVRSSRGFNLTLQVADEAAARDMDLILASGDVFFIQVPPELTPNMSGGYVRIGDTVQHRVADTIKWRFELPCTVVAQPGPGVVGGTMTYGALINLYGGYQNLLAANATYADLLDLMADPSDLVVL